MQSYACWASWHQRINRCIFQCHKLLQLSRHNVGCHTRFASASVHVFQKMAAIAKCCRYLEFTIFHSHNQLTSSYVKQANIIQDVQCMCCYRQPGALSYVKTTYDQLCLSDRFGTAAHADYIVKSSKWLWSPQSTDAGHDTKVSGWSSIQHHISLPPCYLMCCHKQPPHLLAAEKLAAYFGPQNLWLLLAHLPYHSLTSPSALSSAS